MDGGDPRICQTFAASPAEPGELLLGFSGGCLGSRLDFGGAKDQSEYSSKANADRTVTRDPLGNAQAKLDSPGFGWSGPRGVASSGSFEIRIAAPRVTFPPSDKRHCSINFSKGKRELAVPISGS
jgi:hypothetical protein